MSEPVIPPADDGQPPLDWPDECDRMVAVSVTAAEAMLRRGDWDAATFWAKNADDWATEAERLRSLRSPSTETPDK